MRPRRFDFLAYTKQSTLLDLREITVYCIYGYVF